jgi:hypothetical protein
MMDERIAVQGYANHIGTHKTVGGTAAAEFAMDYCRGMSSVNRIPVYCWSMLIQTFMAIFAMAAVMVASNIEEFREHLPLGRNE